MKATALALSLVSFASLMASCTATNPTRERTVETTTASSSAPKPTAPGMQGTHPIQVVTPAQGQSAQQQQQDQYECYANARQQTGFDPTLLASNPPSQSQDQSLLKQKLLAFNDTQSTCLQERGYTVR